jgi:hypothetical protein
MENHSEDMANNEAIESRCNTILNAVNELNLLQKGHKYLTMLLLGLDVVEITSDDFLGVTFAPLFKSLSKQGIKRLIMDCVGPNIPQHLDGRVFDLRFGEEMDLEVKCSIGSVVYHEYSSPFIDKEPQLAVLFNAGLWGYDDWKQTIVALARTRAYILVTSYTSLEAEDDQDCVEDWLGVENIHWLWEPKVNQFHSRVDMRRRTNPAPGDQIYLENYSTMCFRFEAGCCSYSNKTNQKHEEPKEQESSCPMLSYMRTKHAFHKYCSDLENGLGLYEARCAIIHLLGIDIPTQQVGHYLQDLDDDYRRCSLNTFVTLIRHIYETRCDHDWYERTLFDKLSDSSGAVITTDSFHSAFKDIAPTMAANRSESSFILADEYTVGKLTLSQFRRHLFT